MKSTLLTLLYFVLSTAICAQTPSDWAIDVRLGASPFTKIHRTPVDGGENIEHNIASRVGDALLIVSKITFPRQIDPARTFQMYAGGRRSIELKGTIESDEDLLIEGWPAKRFIWLTTSGEKRCSQIAVLIGQELYNIMYIEKAENYREADALEVIRTIKKRG